MTASLSNRTLGLLGAGNMAEALAKGVIQAGTLGAHLILASDVSEARREAFASGLGVKTTTDNAAVARHGDILVLCVKPQQADDVLRQVAPVFEPQRHLLASICAGVTTARMEKLLPPGARVARVMPNTPMLIGLGASGICGGSNATSEDLGAIDALFSSASLVVRVAEPLMDAVTGLSGSGPAYLFYLVEAMADAGMAEGFSREQALALATRTVLGAAKMLEQTGLAPEELRRRVTSPNGTTQAAIERMDNEQVKAKITGAVRRAAERSRELGRG